MINANDLCALFRQARAERWGYIWGKSGQVWTQASQDAATREQTVKWGQRWVGKRVADCSGLFVWAYKQLGASIYHGSNTIYNKYTVADRRGKVADLTQIRPGTAVFQNTNGNRSHIGLYVGGGVVIEAKGTYYGVVESTVDKWAEWGELTDVDYSAVSYEAYSAPLPTLRKGSKGDKVSYLQELLNDAYPNEQITVDGIFGTKTLVAVRTFQYDNGLTVDGIVGAKTWAALVSQTADDETDYEGGADEGDEPVEDAPLTIEQRVERLEQAVFNAK